MVNALTPVADYRTDFALAVRRETMRLYIQQFFLLHPIEPISHYGRVKLLQVSRRTNFIQIGIKNATRC